MPTNNFLLRYDRFLVTYFEIRTIDYFHRLIKQSKRAALVLWRPGVTWSSFPPFHGVIYL